MKPHIIKRNGRWQQFANRNDAKHWPFPDLEARSVRGLTERVLRREFYK